MNLHAKQPDMKAPRNPINKGVNPMPPSNAGSLMMSMTLRNVSPKIGIKTIRKENCAMLSFLFPRMRPVAMVVPERESPGNTARACPNPMMKASR